MFLFKSILNLLSDGQFHSENELSHALKLPSNTISDTLHQTVEPFIFLEKCKNKGFRIPGGIEILNEKLIFDNLGVTKKLISHLEILTSVNSTNTYLLEKKDTLQTLAVFAEQQKAGRGQLNRPWLSSNFGKNIALSILYHLPNKANQLAGLSLVMGIVVAQTLEEYGLKNIKVKWPNDVVYNDKKLAGILIETKNLSTLNHISLVVGIGLNLYNPMKNGSTYDKTIIDIYSIQKLPPQRNLLAGLLLKNSLMTLDIFKQKGFSAFLNLWPKFDNLKNKLIRIQNPKKNTEEGIACGINREGQLCINIKGKKNFFNSGEVRIISDNSPRNC